MFYMKTSLKSYFLISEKLCKVLLISEIIPTNEIAMENGRWLISYKLKTYKSMIGKTSLENNEPFYSYGNSFHKSE